MKGGETWPATKAESIIALNREGSLHQFQPTGFLIGRLVLDVGGPQVEEGLLARSTADEVVMEVSVKSVKKSLEQVRYAACEYAI